MRAFVSSVIAIAFLASTASADEGDVQEAPIVYIGVGLLVALEAAPLVTTLVYQSVGDDRKRSAAKWALATSAIDLGVNALYIRFFFSSPACRDDCQFEKTTFVTLTAVDALLVGYSIYRLATDDDPSVMVAPTVIGTHAPTPGLAVIGSF